MEIPCVHYKCLQSDLTLLIVREEGIKLYGAFSFQVLFGALSANEYMFQGRQFNKKNFINVGIPVSSLPLRLTPYYNHTREIEKEDFEILKCRIKDFIGDTNRILNCIDPNLPMGIVLIKHEMDYASKFLAQQYSQFLFAAERRIDLGPCCSTINVNVAHGQNLSMSNPEYNQIFEKLNHMVSGSVMLIGSKGVGKSTLMNYLANNFISARGSKKKIYILDTDVGQAELTPPGCISLFRLNRPLIGDQFAYQETTFLDSYFFGSISPIVNFYVYLSQVKKLFQTFHQKYQDGNAILFINTIGWVEDMGDILMRHLIRLCEPQLLVNILGSNTTNFSIPFGYVQKTLNFTAAPKNSWNNIKPAILRDMRFAGYFANCFSHKSTSAGSELKLAEVLSYRVRFSSVSIYFHPDIAPVVDRLIFCALNCSVVALCTVEDEYKEYFKSTRVCDNEALPNRLSLADPRILINEQFSLKSYPKKDEKEPGILKCFGYAMIRAIDLEKKIFYLITPVDRNLLNSITVFAIGHELHASSLLFDLKNIEPSPYVMEIGEGVSADHKKLFAPLKNVSQLKHSIRNRKFDKINGNNNVVFKKKSKVLRTKKK